MPFPMLASSHLLFPARVSRQGVRELEQQLPEADHASGLQLGRGMVVAGQGSVDHRTGYICALGPVELGHGAEAIHVEEGGALLLFRNATHQVVGREELTALASSALPLVVAAAGAGGEGGAEAATAAAAAAATTTSSSSSSEEEASDTGGPTPS